MSGLFGERFPYITFYPAVMLTATLCGLGPGFLATGLSVLLAWFWFLPPDGSVSIWRDPDKVGLLLFSGMGVFLTLVAALYQEARRRLANAEKDLATYAKEEKHRAFFENINGFVAIYRAVRDEHGLVTDWIWADMNSRTRELLEPIFRKMGRLRPGEPLLGKRVRELSGTEQTRSLTVKWLGVLAGEPMTHERSFGGREYAVTAFKIGEDAVGTVAFDVTDHKRAEEALRQSEQKLRLAQDAARMGSWDWNIPSGEVVWSNRCKALFGLAPDTVVTYDVFLGTIHPEDRDRIDKAVKDALASRKDYDVEMRVPLPDGTVRWIAAKGRGFYDASGSALRMAGMALDITDAKLAERTLQEQLALKDQFAKVAASVPGLVCSYQLRPDGNVCLPFTTPAVEEVFGFSQVALAKDAAPMMARNHPDDAQRVKDAVSESARTQSLFHEVFRYLHPTKGLRWLEVWSVPRAEPDGSVLWHGFVMDVTDRKRAEQALSESEERARHQLAEIEALYDSAPVGLCVLDTHLRWIRLNRRLAEINGIPVEAHIGKTPHEIIPDLEEQGEAALRRVLETGEPLLDFEMSGVTDAQPGVRRFWNERWVPIKDEQGHVIGVSVAAEEITERKRAEQALRESETLYRSLFTLAPSGVALVEKDGRLAAFNDQAHAQLGYTREEFTGLAISDIDADEEPEDVRLHFARIVDAGGTDFEARHRTKSGEIRETLVRARPVQIGGATCLLAVWHDITESKRAQEALRESDRRKSEFLAMLSHELRNPLAPIRNSLYLLERAPPGSEQAVRARAIIERQTQHLTRLVDDLLDVTRISRGKIELHRECVDLREVVCHTRDDHRSMFEDDEVELSLVLPARPIWADVDATRISQVLGNLLQNAAKFTPARGSVVVAVEMDEGRAIIRVRDSGVGMEPQLVDRLFEPFVQAEHGLARTKGGLGLGLALAKGLVELHGGTVSAKSEGIGHGSELVVELPLAALPRPERPKARGAEATPGRFILIIEDNLDAAQTLASVMEMEGHRVHVATNGTTGIKMACELKPDVVLCDIGLPDVSGYDVARALRANESLRATRLIAVTGYAQPEDRKRATEAGFDAQLGKPASVDKLAALVSQASEGSA